METSERDEVKLLFGPGLSLFTLARISGVPSTELQDCADSSYCIQYVGAAILRVIQMCPYWQARMNPSIAPPVFADFIEAHTTDPSLGFPLAAEIRLHWAVQQLQSSSI